MDGTKDISCVMSHEHRSELQFNQAACPGSYRPFPGVTGRHSRELQADISEAKSEANPRIMNFPNQIRPNEIPGSYRPFSGVTARFRELQIPDLVRTPFSRFGSDCFGLLRDLLRIASGTFRGRAVLFRMIYTGLFSFVRTYGSQKKA